jgi:hypothetical protein
MCEVSAERGKEMESEEDEQLHISEHNFQQQNRVING